MLTFLQILLLIAVIGSAALFRLSISIWAPVLAVVLAVLTYINTLSTLILIALWIILALSIVLFDIPPIRRMLLAKPTLKFFKSSLPPMSETERVALKRVMCGGKVNCFVANQIGKNYWLIINRH